MRQLRMVTATLIWHDSLQNSYPRRGGLWPMSRAGRVTACLAACLCLPLSVAAAVPDDPREGHHGAASSSAAIPDVNQAQVRHSGGRVEITLPTTDGVVTVSEIAEQTGSAFLLDLSVLPAGLFHGAFDLNNSADRRKLYFISGVTPDLAIRIRNHEDGTKSLLIRIDVDDARRKTARTKSVIRTAVGKIGNREFGIQPVREGDTSAIQQALVILVHGYNSTPDSLTELEAMLRMNGFSVAQFRYPDDGPIRESAELLSKGILKLRQQSNPSKIIVITHSMGGLVARAAIESRESDRPRSQDERGDSRLVDQLLMVAPPNHGSDLARLKGGLDWYQMLSANEEKRPQALIRQTILDGLNEAAADLHPDSEFLRRLNANSRAQGVQYSIIAGNAALLTAGRLQSMQQNLQTLLTRSRATAVVAPWTNDFIVSLDEWIDGQGDGLVSVESTKLEGVDDFVVLPMKHSDIALSPDHCAATRQLFDEIACRLSVR